MPFSTRLAAGLLACVAPLLLGAGKPKPQPAPFTPALAFKYGAEEIRLANADGSQAVLLVRKPRGDSILWLTLAPLSERRVAFIDATSNGAIRSVRLASWVPQAGGGLAVTIDAQPLISSSNPGMIPSGLDFSSDGKQLAVVTSDYHSRSELRVFDVASRSQIGEPVVLDRRAVSPAWRSSDNSLLLRGNGMLSYKDGVQTVLFESDNFSEFDTFNGSSPKVILPYKDYLVPGNTLQLWDGQAVSNGQPVLTKIADGIGGSISCDNSRMIYTELGAKRSVYNLVFDTGTKILFSRDSNVQRMTYPGSCT